MSRHLVVCHVTAHSQALQSELGEIARLDDKAEFTVLVPSTPKTYWKAWDIVEETERAGALAKEVASMLHERGFRVTRAVSGSREPLLAIDDELRDSPGYAGIVISTLPSGASRWLRRDLLRRAQDRFGLPVRHVVAADIAVPDDSDASGDDFAAEHQLSAGRSVSSGPLPAPIQRTLSAISNRESSTAQVATSAVAVQERPREEHPVAMDIQPTMLARALAGNQPISKAFWSLQMQLEQRSGLEPELGELVALRVAQLRHFAQLWQEHVLIARALGVADERMAAIEHWRSAEHVHFTARERAVLAYADAVCADANTALARSVLEQHLNETEIADLTLLVGFYRMSGSFAQALSLQTDGPFVGWALFRGVATGQHL